MTDYAATPHAHRERYEKAQKIAQMAWNLGATPEDLLHGLTDPQWAALARRATAKTASDETKRLAYCHLSLREAWAAGHPEHPDSRRIVRPLDQIAADLTTRRTRT